MDRTGNAVDGLVQCVAKLLSGVVLANPYVVFGELLEDSGDVPLVTNAPAEAMAGFVPRDGDDRYVVTVGRGDPEDLIGCAGTDVRQRRGRFP